MTKNHAEYDESIDYWEQIRIFLKGKRSTQKYLQDVVHGNTTEDARRNKDYKARAKYINFPARTKNALTGAVFSKEANYELPTALEFMIYNANGAGKSLEHVAKDCVSNVIAVGRHGILAAYDTELGQSKLVTYTAENIIDWEEDENGKLIHVVLRLSDKIFRHLLLENGAYTVEDRDEDGELIKEPVIPTKSDGTTFKEIPFIAIGSVDNSPDVDDSPIWSIVDITQGHYQNSADYEDMLRILQPTPWVNNIDKQYMDEMYPSGFIPFGTGAIVTLPKDGQAGLLQPNENQMISQAMEHKENLLIMLGARLIQNAGQAETAEAVRIKYSSENGILTNLVGNVSRAIEQGLEWCAEFMGANPEDVVYVLNREFFDVNMTPQQISAEILLLDRGVKAMTDVRSTLRQSGNIDSDRTDEDIDAEVEESGGGLI